MPTWVIRSFWNERRGVFQREYEGHSDATRAKLRAVLNGLRAETEIQGWCRENGFDRLSGKYRELGKLRFKVENVQHRPLGFFGPARHEFTLLVWATERGDSWRPPDVRDTALTRMKMIIDDPRRAHEFDF